MGIICQSFLQLKIVMIYLDACFKSHFQKTFDTGALYCNVFLRLKDILSVCLSVCLCLSVSVSVFPSLPLSLSLSFSLFLSVSVCRAAPYPVPQSFPDTPEYIGKRLFLLSTLLSSVGHYIINLLIKVMMKITDNTLKPSNTTHVWSNAQHLL